MNLERNIFDWLVNLNSFSTNEIVTSQSRIFFYKMIINLDEMLPSEIIDTINVLNNELEKKENSKGVIGLEVRNIKGNMCCPKCSSNNIKKNGKYMGRQLYKCKDCNKKFNVLTNTPFHHTRLRYKQIEEAYKCLINKLSIRKMANIIGISIKTAFILRFKIISCLSNVANNKKLKGTSQLDEYYLPINLKGTKTQNMPRASKKRQKNGTGTSGISKHTVCVVSGVDENDNMFFKVGGTSSVSSNMIRNIITPFIENGSKVITDCKSSYESIAIENNWNLKQIKSACHVDNEGNSLATINSLHSELDLFLSGFRGVSTKHLPQYLDWFVYIKHLNYTKEYNEQASEFKKDTITLNTPIKCSNVFNNYSNIKFSEIYADYYYQPPKCIT